MRSTNIDMTAIQSMDDLYLLLEQKALLLTRNWDITDILVKYREHASSDLDKQLAQWELECFLFTVRGNKVFSYSYSTGKDVGRVKQFPELDSFQLEAFDYLKKRAKEAENPLLLARYNHLLLKSPKGIKNKEYAISAINAYLKLIPAFFLLFEEDGDGESQLQASNKIENLLELVSDVKVKIEETKVLIDQVLYKMQTVPFYVKHSLLKHMLEKKQCF